MEPATLDYGMIGNGQINALISPQGAIDWACMPNFESQAVFAAILDPEQGGTFKIEPCGDYGSEQQYLKNTAILQTRIYSRESRFNLIDFAPRHLLTDGVYKPVEIHRLIEITSGEPEVRIIYDPRLNFARGETQFTIEGNALVATLGDEKLYLYSNVDYQAILRREPVKLTQGAYFILSYGAPLENPGLDRVVEQFRRTSQCWRTWVKHCYIPPQYQNEIIRSAITLKLLVYEDTGAIIAAPTTSIPETFGEVRNWDYRYCWLRDSYFVVHALIKLSQFEELEGFVAYLKGIIRQKMDSDPSGSLDYLRPLYNIFGEAVPEEIFLDHLSGFNNSRPVRIGNSATTHFQHDIYGELVQALYPMFFDQRIVRDDMEHLWQMTTQLVEAAIQKFPEEDNGIWEFRNYRRHYTFSKLMCWLAVDRGVKIAEHLSKVEQQHWQHTRNKMRTDILDNAWNPDIQAFSQSYGSEHLDASTLLMPVCGFISARDPRMKSTINLSEKRLVKNHRVFRYTNQDDFGTPQNAFTICTFWLIDALIMAGETKKALFYFENILQHANPVGLFSEDINPTNGLLTGNFPQGYTHVAIINTAMKLNNHNFYFM